MEEAFVTEAITLTLDDEIDISRGDMIVKSEDLPSVGTAVKAHIVWMAEEAIAPGKLVDIKLGSKSVSGSIQSIDHLIDVNTLEKKQASQLELNSIALCTVHFNQTVAFDSYRDNKATGAFIIIDRMTNVTVGAGMIESSAEDHTSSWEPVSEAEKAARLEHQVPRIIQCQGEAADILGQAVERKLFNLGQTSILITEHMANSATEKALIAKAIKLAGLIAIVCSNESTVNADLILSADTDTDIPKQTKLVN